MNSLTLVVHDETNLNEATVLQYIPISSRGLCIDKDEKSELSEMS